MQSMTSEGKTVVFFDLETTGFDTGACDIIQLAAISGDHTFNKYVMPETPITSGAADVTGFSIQDGSLLQRGIAKPTVPLHEALTSFFSFLQSFMNPVLLAAHNAKRFDMPVLARALFRCSLRGQFEQLDTSFLDTFLLGKRLYPGRASYSQVNLVQYFLGKNYNAHDALDDVMALQELYASWDPSPWHVNACLCSL